MLPPPTCNSGRRVTNRSWPAADEKLLMTNPSEEPEEQGPKKVVRIILPREVCTTPEETAKLVHRAIQEALRNCVQTNRMPMTVSDTPHQPK
jgi:hypothetical protein